MFQIPNYEYFKHPNILYGRQFMASDNGTHVFVQSLQNPELNIGLDKGNMDEIVGISTKGIECEFRKLIISLGTATSFA